MQISTVSPQLPVVAPLRRAVPCAVVLFRGTQCVVRTVTRGPHLSTVHGVRGVAPRPNACWALPKIAGDIACGNHQADAGQAPPACHGPLRRPGMGSVVRPLSRPRLDHQPRGQRRRELFGPMVGLACFVGWARRTAQAAPLCVGPMGVSQHPLSLLSQRCLCGGRRRVGRRSARVACCGENGVALIWC